jgi:hypothetical protein
MNWHLLTSWAPPWIPAATPPASTRNPEFRPRRAWRPKTIGLAISVHASVRERCLSQYSPGISLGGAALRFRQPPDVVHRQFLLPEQRRDRPCQRNDGLLGAFCGDGLQKRAVRFSVIPAYEILKRGRNVRGGINCAVVSERSWRLQRRAPPQLIGRIDPHGGHRSAGRVQLADRDVRASRPKSSVGSNCSRECRDPRTARAGPNARPAARGYRLQTRRDVVP